MNEGRRGLKAGVWLVAAALAWSVAAAPAAPAITADVVYGHKDGMALVYDVFRPRQANGTNSCPWSTANGCTPHCRKREQPAS